MANLVLAVNPIIAGLGQFAAIVICFYVLVFVLLALVFNAGTAFGLAWLREKTEALKILRKSVESAVSTTEAAVEKGIPPGENESPVVRAVATVPIRMNELDQKVNQGADQVAKVVIEARARMEQGKAIIKTLLLPGMVVQEKRLQAHRANGSEMKSPGYQILMEQKAPEVPVESPNSNGTAQTVTAKQLKHAARR